VEVLLNLTPLDLLIMAEASLALYRLHIPQQTTGFKTEVGMVSIWENVGDPFWTCGQTTLFLFIITPKPLRSSLTKNIVEIKIPSFLSTL
jgi:hypothetical protein